MATLATWLVLAALGAPSADPAQARAIFERAQAAANSGDYEASLTLLRQAYPLDPRPELMNNIGKMLENLGRYTEAKAAYDRVLSDPRAEAELKRKDEERLRAIAPKLEQAWLRFDREELGALVMVDGRALGTVSREERPVPAGSKLLEVYAPSRRELEIHQPRFAVGDTVLLQSSADDAHLELGELPIVELRLDGQRVSIVPAPATRLRVAPGDHELRVEHPRRRPVVWRGTIPAGGVVRVPDPPPELSAPAAAPSAAVAPPPPAAPRGAPWPWLLGTVGAGLAGAGVALLADAHQDAARVNDAPRVDGVITTITYREARELESSVDAQGARAVGLILAGGTAVAGAVLWELLRAN